MNPQRELAYHLAKILSDTFRLTTDTSSDYMYWDIRILYSDLCAVVNYGPNADVSSVPLNVLDNKTYRRVFGLDKGPLWDGLTPSQYVTAMVAFQDHPQFALLKIINERVLEARNYVGDHTAFRDQLYAIAHIRSHPLDSDKRREYLRRLRDVLDESEYEVLKRPPDLGELFAPARVNQISPVK